MKKTLAPDMIERAADILNQVADGTIKPDDALGMWPLPISNVDRVFIDAWVQLQHFSDDADICAIETDYHASQIDLIRRNAARILKACREMR